MSLLFETTFIVLSFSNTLSWMVNHNIFTMPHILSQGHKSQA